MVNLEFYRDREQGYIILVDSLGFATYYKGNIVGDFGDKKRYEKLGDRPDIVAKFLIEQGIWMYDKIYRAQKGELEELTKSEKPESTFRDEHGIERTVEDSDFLGDHHGNMPPPMKK